MKKLFLFVFFLLFFNNLSVNKYQLNKKTCFVPMSDSYPNRYFYHTPFQYNRFDSMRQWLCKGNFAVRYQYTYNGKDLASCIFDNPMIANNNNNYNYNAGTLGIGSSLDTNSKLFINASRNSLFIDCTIDISKVNSPYYIHVGIPVERTEQKITINEIITTDGFVIKGGFVQEYQPKTLTNLEQWQNTNSSIISALPSLEAYLAGKTIGDKQEPLFGIVSQCPMTLWALADLYIQLGYDGCQYKNINYGYYLKGIIPTSPTLQSISNRFLFYPTIGNVDRFELGCGINGNLNICDNDSMNQTLYFDGYAGYLFTTNHLRPFDLKNGFFTRYGQVKLFDQQSLNYVNKTIWAVDLTTLNTDIGGCFKSELVLDFVYQYFQSFFNIGYSFKSQSKENISCFNNNSNVIPILDRYIYGYSPQQYVQTPNPIKNQNNWTCQLITPSSSMQYIDEADMSVFQDTQDRIVGVPISQDNQLLKSDVNFHSGIMNLQILNIFFIGYAYETIKTEYNTIFAIKLGRAMTNVDSFVQAFNEILISLELDY